MERDAGYDRWVCDVMGGVPLAACLPMPSAPASPESESRLQAVPTASRPHCHKSMIARFCKGEIQYTNTQHDRRGSGQPEYGLRRRRRKGVRRRAPQGGFVGGPSEPDSSDRVAAASRSGLPIMAFTFQYPGDKPRGSLGSRLQAPPTEESQSPNRELKSGRTWATRTGRPQKGFWGQR
jgi:hypothetical protein